MVAGDGLVVWIRMAELEYAMVPQVAARKEHTLLLGIYGFVCTKNGLTCAFCINAIMFSVLIQIIYSLERKLTTTKTELTKVDQQTLAGQKTETVN